MKKSLSILLLVLSAACATLPPAAAAAADGPSKRDTPELAYLKLVNSWRPPADPQLLLLLMAQFANNGQHAAGAEFIDGLLKRFGPGLDDRQRAVYLTAIASLRAGHARDVPLLQRIGWVRTTLGQLDEALRLAGDDPFLPRWMSGVVRAQLPAMLGERERAEVDLAWCIDNAARAPHAGWLREAYFQLASIRREQGRQAEAERLQARSGLPAGAKHTVLTTPFSIDNATAGHRFTEQRIREVVPGSIYVVSGVEFTEFHFVISADRQQLIAIDAGTRADSAQAAYDALSSKLGGLPPLTTVFVTHAHWDHVGGHRQFRKLNPAVRFVGRGNYEPELQRGRLRGQRGLRSFFGNRFDLGQVLDYRPDVVVDQPTEMTLGGTRFELLPTEGGETPDAMMIHLPANRVLFLGDVLMPYIGAPFSEEGSVDGLLSSIRQVEALQPEVLLHGHEPLTRVFASTRTLKGLAGAITWLRGQVLEALPAGTERAALQQANLVPPALADSGSDVHLAYLVIRENLVNRVVDQNSGYWQNGLHGLDSITNADRGEALLDYVGVSEDAVVKAAARLQADGKHEVAASMLSWALARSPGSAPLRQAYREASEKLMERFQEFNPFKFILYGAEVRRMRDAAAAPAPASGPAP